MSIIDLKIGEQNYKAIPTNEYEKLTTVKLTKKQEKTARQRAIESASMSWKKEIIS